MAVANPLRDMTNAIFESLGYTVPSNFVNNKRDGRYITVEYPAPKVLTVKERYAWKRERMAELTASGLVFDPEERGTIKNSVFSTYGTLPGYVSKPAEKAPNVHELPASVSAYITDVLGRQLDEVVAHRFVNGEEPLYAVLMGTADALWTVIFVGSYRARVPLGAYEEASPGNAVLVTWNCLSDADEWEYSVAKFRNAPASVFWKS